MMLEQEKKNLEKLRDHESQNGSEIFKAETNIRTLQEQLRQSTNDVSLAIFFLFWWLVELNRKHILLHNTNSKFINSMSGSLELTFN